LRWIGKSTDQLCGRATLEITADLREVSRLWSVVRPTHLSMRSRLRRRVRHRSVEISRIACTLHLFSTDKLPPWTW
jgi:hypothetical protein